MLINSPNISGSLKVTGNTTVTGSLTVLGGINGAITGSATTASYVEYSNVANKPTLVSGSEQISFNGITDKPTLVSGSSQVTYSGLTGIPSGIVSGSGQVSFNGITDKPTLVSGSSQITYSGLTGIPSGIVSGSSQVSFNGIVDKPTLVSGSAQIDFAGISNKPTLVSGSSQISFNGITDKPTLVSGSSQITYSGLTGIPSGIVSGSAQVAAFGYATTGSNTFIGNQTITGSILGSGSLTIDGCITATGQIVAQTINVQQVTSSIVYSCGSNIFGTSLSNTQQFTGSMFITGSNLNANVGSACFQGSVCANNIVLNTSYSAGGTANVQTWQRTGGAVAADIIYNDANTSMNFGTSTAHSLNIKTNNTTALAINSSGIACFACQVCAAGNLLLGGAGTANTIPQYTAAGVLANSRMTTYGNGCFSVNFGWSVCARIGFDNDNTGTYFYGLELDNGTRRLNIIGKAPDSNSGVGIWTGTTSYEQRLVIGATGIACFACQVCAPSFVGGTVSGTNATISNAGTACTVTDILTLANTQSGPASVCAGAGILFTGNLGGTVARIYSRGNMNFNNGSDLVFQTQASAGALQCTMVINGGSQNVGIGTFTPQAKLTVSGAGVEAHINNGDTNTLTLGNFSSGRHFIKSINLGVALTPLTLQASSFTFDTGNVGIGTTLPQSPIDVISPTNGYVSFGRNISVGQFTGIHFGYREDNTNYRKSAIVFERTGAAAQGNIHFLNNNTADITSASLADSRMVITSNGSVTIGTSCAAFGRPLTVSNDIVAYFSNQENITIGLSAGTGQQSWGIQVCDTGDGGSALHLNARGGNVGINKGSGNNAAYPLDVTGIVASSTGFLVNSGAYNSISEVPYTGMYMTAAGSSDGFGALLISSRTDIARPIIFGTSNGSVSTERMRITSGGLILSCGRTSSIMASNGNIQEWVGTTGAINNNTGWSLFSIANIYDILAMDIYVFTDMGSFHASKHEAVFGYTASTYTGVGLSSAFCIFQTGTLYNETMTICNLSGSNINNQRIAIRVWGYGVGQNGTGGSNLLNTSCLTRIK